MTNKEFFEWVSSEDSGVYTQFNKLRDALFLNLSHTPKFPRKRSELEEVLSEIDDQMVTKVIDDCAWFGEKDGFIYCKAELGSDYVIHYFVNTTTERADIPIAKHWQLVRYYGEGDDEKRVITSVIVVNEKHPNMRPVQYPKVIKHELVHSAIESKLMYMSMDYVNFYWSEDEDTSKFIEFLCSIIPYLSTPVKKENGASKFMDDMKVVFRYDPDDERIQGYMRIVNGTAE